MSYMMSSNQVKAYACGGCLAFVFIWAIFITLESLLLTTVWNWIGTKFSLPIMHFWMAVAFVLLLNLILGYRRRND